MHAVAIGGEEVVNHGFNDLVLGVEAVAIMRALAEGDPAGGLVLVDVVQEPNPEGVGRR